MSWTFIVVVLAVVAVPGADFVVTLRNTIVNGRAAGVATAVGISAGSLIQGTLASVGVGVLILQSQLLFTTLKWTGLAYLAYLGAQSLWSAWRGHHDAALERLGNGRWARSLRQGFLTNMTNPKMLVFFLSLLPQFVAAGSGVGDWLIHAWMLPIVGTAWLLVVVLFGNAAREKLLRPVARRIMDTISGLALLGFATKLALEHD